MENLKEDFSPISQKDLSLNIKPNFMLLDLDLGGHHGSYIQHLIEYWHRERLPGNLDIVVRPEFFGIHVDPINLVSKYSIQNVRFIAISQDETTKIDRGNSSLERFFRNLQRWKLCCKYARQLKSSHILLLYFDVCELPLAFGANAPCPFSGIYFRPTFHYGDFASSPSSWRERIQRVKERMVLNRIFQHQQLQNLFCLDPLAVKSLRQFSRQKVITHLPDPVQLDGCSSFTVEQLKKRLGIQPNRQIFLLFGALDSRKGIDQLLEALRLVPRPLCEKLCLILAGGTHAREQARIHDRVAQVAQIQPVQIIEDYRFIPEAEVSAYFQLADVVLAPYQRHVGMSGILLLAAAAGKPVLSSDYGLMGELVRRYRLGITIDSTQPEALAEGMAECLTGVPGQLGDRDQMKAFAEQNSAERYARTIFQHLYANHGDVPAPGTDVIDLGYP